MTTTASTGLSVRDASKAFGTRTLWKNLSFDVPAGSMLALTGASGSGKTTLLNCLGLLEDLDAGELLLDDVRISQTSPRLRRLHRRDTLGYLFQNYALIDNATVRENMDVAVGKMTWGRRRMPRAYEDALEQVGMGGRSGEPAYRLSGGEQQRVAIARLLLKRPRLVLADEPTGALDAANAAAVIDHLARLATQGSIVVVATHNAEVAQVCDAQLRLGDPVPAHAGPFMDEPA